MNNEFKKPTFECNRYKNGNLPFKDENQMEFALA